MSSNRPHVPTSYRVKRFLSLYGPWIAWSCAILVVIWLSQTVSSSGVAAGMAEIRQVTLSSVRAAVVTELLVAPGDKVKKDQVLVRLDRTAVSAELAVAQAELQQRQTEVAAQGVSLREGNLETVERLAGDSERAALTVAQLEAEEQRDRSELKQLDEQIARQKKLVAEKLAAVDTLNTLNLRRAALARKVVEYKRTLQKARAHARAAKERLGEWQQGKKPLPEEASDQSMVQRLAPYRAAVLAQEQRVAQLQKVLAGLDLKAPFAGRVGAVMLRPGDTAQVGSGVVTVVDDQPQQVIVYVDQMWASRVRPGDRAQLVPSDRVGPKRAGRVAAVGASITEMPIRFRPIPNQPAFCREIFIVLDSSKNKPPLPGKAFDVRFQRQKGDMDKVTAEKLNGEKKGS